MRTAFFEDTLKGNFSLHKTSSNVEEHHNVITIEVEDDTSHTRAVEIRLPLLSFTNALFGSSYLDCEYVINRTTPGLHFVHETRVVFLPKPTTHEPYNRERDRARAEAALKPYETDGWRGRADDLLNMHRRNSDLHGNGGDYYNVHFWRYLHDDGTPLLWDEEERAQALRDSAIDLVKLLRSYRIKVPAAIETLMNAISPVEEHAAAS
jgi:hypothetical protein